MSNNTNNTIHAEPSGNLYLDFDRNADDSTDKFGRTYLGLRTQVEKLRQKHGNAFLPSLQDGDDILEFFRDRFFSHERVQTLLVSNLTIGNKPKEVNLLIRPATLLPSMERELPAGLSIVLRVKYQIESIDKRTQTGKVNMTPLLVVSRVEMSHCCKRDFEQEITVNVISAYSLDDYTQGRTGDTTFWKNNAISLDFVEQLPPISQTTQRHLAQWNEYLNFCEQYTRAQLDGLRFIRAEFENGTYRFLVLAESQEAFYKHSKFLRNDDVQVFSVDHSTEPWTFKLNEEERYPKSVRLGDYVRPASNQPQPNVSLPENLLKELGLKKAYCTWISYKLDDERQEMYETRAARASAKEHIEKLDAEFLNHVPQTGWLSPSASGDFALINRLRSQLRILQEQGGYAPHLSSYLFDIKNARQPQTLVEITDWMNPNLNEDQKNAVRKMLSTLDIGLLQGPPGTGKTEVIAELIYQLVKRGMTVGVFSQANLAVDNALDRLALDPIIRAVRLGKKAEADGRYHQDNVLGTYYEAIAENCRKNTLGNWADWENQIESLTDWLHTTEFVYLDVCRLNEARNNAETDYDREEVGREFSAKRNQLLELMRQQSQSPTVSEYPQLREAVEKQLQNAKAAYENMRPTKDAWADILTDWTADITKPETLQHDKSSYVNSEYIHNCNVVGMSCTGNTRMLLEAGYTHFDVVIIDEVSKATPPELIIPMLLGKTAILVGDHRQLPPVFKHEGTSFEELVVEQSETEQKDNVLTEENLNRFKKMVTTSWFKEQFEKAPESLKASLWIQYRMHPGIMHSCNPFYENRLTCGLQNPDEQRRHGLTLTGERRRSILTPEQHVLWIDSGNLPTGKPNWEEKTGTGKSNKLEAALIAKMLMQLEEEYRKQGFTAAAPKQVAVITFYGKQLREIRNAIRNAGNFTALKVSVNTVDKFQGQERPIVFVSMVRCRNKLDPRANTASFERINVAFSRAQELLVIVGAAKTFNSYPVVLPNLDNTGVRTVNVYKNLMDELDRNACFHTAKDILSGFEFNRLIGVEDTPRGYIPQPIFNRTDHQQKRTQ